MNRLHDECWVITDHAAGNQRQALALAGALGMPVRHLVRVPRAPWSWFAPRLFPGYLRALGPEQRLRPDTPWPRIVVGCGRTSGLFTRMLGRLSHGRSFTVQLLDPRIDPGHWDLVVAPRHDGLSGENVITPLGSLHSIDAAWLEDARDASPAIADLPTPRIGVLLGGPRKTWPLDAAYVDKLASHLLARQQRDGGSIMALASRRTPTAAIEALRVALQGVPGFVWNGRQDGHNPYPGVLAWADRLIVTPDSVNMLSEACAVGCPVHTLVDTALPARLRRFHEALGEAGLLHDIDDEGTMRQPPLRELPAIARQVLARMREHEHSGNQAR